MPRFHLTWGTGPEVVRVFAEPVLAGEERGLVEFGFRHRVDDLVVEDGAVVGVRGTVLEPSDAERGVSSSREVVGEFELRAPAVVVTSGGIGHNHDLIRENWPVDRLGPAPAHMISGVPAHVDGRMLGITEDAGGADRQPRPDVALHRGHPQLGPDLARPRDPDHPRARRRCGSTRPASGCAAPNFPGFDSLGTLREILATGHDYSWFVLTQTIIEKEFALSGSEQNPDITGKDLGFLVKSRLAKGAPGPVEAFKEHGEDFVVADNLADLVAGMNRALPRPAARPRRRSSGRSSPATARSSNGFSKDLQLMAIANARRSRTDRLVRVAKPHRILDPEHGPLIAVRLNILTRKTLGGLETNLDSQVMRPDGTPFPGLYAAGEVAGFGGGGVHGYNALEGTFLGGCIFSGRAAGRALARAPH